MKGAGVRSLGTPWNCVTPRPLVTPTLSFLTAVGCGLLLLGCAESTPPASPRSDVREVHVHRAADKPDLIRLERDGDPTAAVAAAYVHGGTLAVSHAIAERVTAQLTDQGYVSVVTPTEGALLVSLSLGDTPPAGNLVGALRTALTAGRTRSSEKPAGVPHALRSCGTLGAGRSAAPPSRTNTVLAVVGSAQRLETVQANYDADAVWPDGPVPQVALPKEDEFSASPAVEPSELVVAIRTPLRQRILPAARAAGAPKSLLGLLAASYPGRWNLLTSHASFVPGGGCVAVQLEARERVDVLYAARAAKAVRRELEWLLAEQTHDEDPRFNVLEAPSAEDAARRAAWEAATRLGFAEDAPSTAFVHYRGRVDVSTWQSLLEAKSEPEPIAVATQDEHGQGRVWAQLDNPCPLTHEDNATAGHTTAALLAAARAVPGTNLELASGWDDHGLLGWQATHERGAEDRLAEGFARGLLEALQTPALASGLVRQPDGDLDTPPWTLALTLATNGHPSWLSQRSTPQSRALFDGTALEAALRRFATGPLELRVLTNHGPAQASRLATRLAHLLSGVHTSNAPCPAVSVGPTPSPAGEYEIATSELVPAVAIYVVDRRFASAVRQLASGLNQPGGWLRRAVEPLGARVTAIGLGAPSTMAALGFTVAADSREVMDAALGQLRTLVADLVKAPASSLTAPSAALLPGPTERLADLGKESEASTAGVAALVSEGLTERRLFIVRPLTLPKALDSRGVK